MSFEQQIQQWVALDNQLKSLNDKVKELRDKRNTLTETIQLHAQKNNLSTSTIKISDGQLKFTKVKETQPLTFKYLENCLTEIVKNKEQVEKIMDYIKNKREVKYSDEIKRFYNK